MAGTKYTINTGNLDKKNCSYERYQPFIFSTIGNSNCAFRKSTCTSDGLIIYNDGSIDNDRTCSCDYTQGYAFVTPPTNRCYCVPSKEDCSCYLKRCDNKQILSPDYNCVEETYIQYHPYKCLTTFLKRGQQNENVNFLLTDSKGIVSVIQNKVGCVILISVVIVLAIFSVYVCSRQHFSGTKTDFNKASATNQVDLKSYVSNGSQMSVNNGNTESTESKVLIEHDVESIHQNEGATSILTNNARTLPTEDKTRILARSANDTEKPTHHEDSIAAETKEQDGQTKVSTDRSRNNHQTELTAKIPAQVTHGNDSSDEENYQDCSDNNDSKNEVTHGNDSSDEENYQDCSEKNDSKNATFIENIKTTKDANQTTPPETDAESVAPGIHHIDLDVQVDQKDHLPKTVDEERTTSTSANCASDLSEDKEIATIASGNIHPKPSKDDRKLSETLEFQHTIDANNVSVTAQPVHIIGHNRIDLDIQVDQKKYVPKAVDEVRTTPTCANCASDLSEYKEIATIATGNIHPKPSKDDRNLSETFEFQHTIDANNATVTAEPVHILGHNNIDLDVQVDQKEHVPKTVDEERSTPTCANCASNLSEDKEIATIATGNIQPKPSKDDRKLSKTLEFQHTIHANNASVTAQPVHIIGHNKQLSSTITETPKSEVDVDISAESLMTENAEISNTANNITQQQHKEADSAQPVSPLAYVVPSEPTISCTVQPSPVCAENVVVRSQHPLTGSKQGQYAATYEDDSQNGSTLRDFELHETDPVVNTTATVPIDKALEAEATPDDNCCIVAAEKKYLKEVKTTSFAEAIQTVPENAQSATLPGSTDCTKQNLTAHKQMHDADVSDFQIILDEIDTTDGKSEESKEIE